MWKTVIFLIATLVGLPVIAYYSDEAPSVAQWSIAWSVTQVYLVLATLCFIVSFLTKNYSQVDKLWSIAPIAYAWQVCYLGHFESRLLLIAVLISIWGIRLTYNFARRGGYSWKFWTGEEDYRWAVLRSKPEFQAPWKWFLFNLFFISFYQMGLVMLIVFPMIKASGHPGITIWDIFLAIAVLFWILIEFIADHQQYQFQTEKHRRIATGESLDGYAHGFTNIGLWKISRHPNYLGEQSVWVTIYFFSVVASGSWANWSMVGAILLLLLFYGSSNFSEEITASKYPEYTAYQRKTGRFFPKISAFFTKSV
jgi:steroid 5-alpha reductase family enzyme